MKLLLLTLGTRGDVQPFVALGVALKRAGYEVRVCAPSSFAPLVTEHGLAYAPMRDEVVQLTRAQEGREILGEAGSPLGLLKGWLRLARRVSPMQRRVLDDSWAAQGVDAIIYHPKALAGTDLGERLEIPVCLALPAPALVPTCAFPSPVLPPLKVVRPLQSAYNRATYRLPQLMNATTAGVVNRWRKEVLGLGPCPRFLNPLRYPDGRAVPVLHAFSPHVAPPPADWPEGAEVTGYWLLEAREWHMPDDLSEFLRAGPPPVYVGFGSIAGRDPAGTAETVVRALALAGQRGVLATGWGGLEAEGLPNTVFKLESAPHAALFPHMAAVVHHGGAGTTAAGLRAGKPTVVCPFFGDQPFWGARVAVLGVGPDPIPQRRLTEEGLAAAIRRATTDAQMQRRTSDLGAKLRAEAGTGRAVAVLERYLTAAK